jgi:hypothetical protein
VSQGAEQEIDDDDGESGDAGYGTHAHIVRRLAGRARPLCFKKSG